MNTETNNKPYIINYSNHFEFNGKTLAYRKKLLFDITGTPTALFCANNSGFYGYWINRDWLNENKIQELIKHEIKQVDVSHLASSIQEQLNNVFL